MPDLNPETFGIRGGYYHRVDNAFFDDTPLKDEWQREVYELASQLAVKLNAESIADIGCGSGYKLTKYFPDIKTIGFELEPTLTYLRETYPDRDWRLSDFEAIVEPVDIVICSDVIEHIPDPNLTISLLSRIPLKALVISTPERQLVYGHDHSGPPANPAHCREWTLSEFKTYVSRWFDISDALVTNQTQATQALICSVKSNYRPGTKID